jgi:hypothetical protein
METRSPASKTTTEGSAAFVPIPDLEKMSVGHAGLYPTDDAIDVKTADVVSAEITLSLKGGKTLIDCEQGIKSFVKDLLAKKLVESVIDKDGNKSWNLGNYNLTPEDVKHLPNSETGVWVHYLTEGIIRDFGKTWEATPVSLSKKQSPIAKAKAKGKRVLSKKEKNDLLASRNFDYYEKQIADGEITTQDAISLMMKAVEKVKEYEAEGFYLSPKKTDGVLLFNSKEIVLKENGRKDGYKLYTKNMLEVLVPSLIENFFALEAEDRPAKLTKEVLKVTSVKGVFYNIQELVEELKKDKMQGPDLNAMEKNCIINAAHLVKIKKSGMMKDRWLCFDCTNKKTGEQELFLFTGNMNTHLRNG